jgi:hypothetical protein
MVKTERGLTKDRIGARTEEDGHPCSTSEFPLDEPFINSGNITIMTVLKKVKQVRISATYEHAGKNTNYPCLLLMASSWGFLLSAVFS